MPNLPEKPTAIPKLVKGVADRSTGLEVITGGITGGKNSRAERVIEINLLKEPPTPRMPRTSYSPKKLSNNCQDEKP